MSVSCDLLLYADDSCVVYSDKTFDNIETKLNDNLIPYVIGLLTIKLSIHFGDDKTKGILFGTKKI